MITQEEMNVLVLEKIKEIEQKYQIQVLWCVESGSRAWGFPSLDSDFDIRFIYKRNKNAYLKLNKDKDTIELPIDEVWDMSGWDLDKTLSLLMKCNPTIYEWFDSNIIYKRTEFKEQIKPYLDMCFQEEKMLYHYLNMALNNYYKLFADNTKVKLKKYFYILREILSCGWIIKYHQSPPILFDTLKNEFFSGEILDLVNNLLDIKKQSVGEAILVDRYSLLDSYIENTVKDIKEYLNNIQITNNKNININKNIINKNIDKINDFFIMQLDMQLDN